jgi:hypothetical protein
MGQCGNNLSRLQPRSVIGIEVGKHDKAGAIEDVGGRYRQCETFRSGLRRIGVTERQVSSPEILRRGEGNPITRGDFDGTTIEKIRKIDEIAAPASEPEQGRRLAGFLRRWREGWFCKRLDRAARGINHLGFSIRLVLATAYFKLRLQRHRAAPDKRGGTRGAFLTPADLRHPYRGNILYSWRE